MAEGGDKTEAATPRRRNEARQEGNIARSPDLGAAAALTAGIIVLHIFGMHIFNGLRAALEVVLSPEFSANPTRADDTASLTNYCMTVLAQMAGPVVLCVAAAVLLVTLLQVGLVFTTRPLEFDLTKLNPLRGLGNFFSFRAAFRTVMSLGKIAILASVAGSVIWSNMPRILTLAELDLMPLFATVCGLIYDLALKLALILLLLAVADYAWQRFQRERDLRMSKQEIKEEMRRMDGDPQTKSRRARVARQLALQRIGHAVPKADVVVTNPTHFAIALRYESKSMKAPKVVAKGADFLALRIRQLATANGVPMVERRSLAQALYKNVQVGQEVPPQFYSAVAEILAYVYRLSGRKIA